MPYPGLMGEGHRPRAERNTCEEGFPAQCDRGKGAHHRLKGVHKIK